MIIAKLNPAAVVQAARSSRVKSLSLFENQTLESHADGTIEQVGGGYSGTLPAAKMQNGAAYNYGNGAMKSSAKGYRGSGVKIAHLDNREHITYSAHLPYPKFERLVDGSVVTDTENHASKCVSVLSGQAYTVGGRTFEGLAPDVTKCYSAYVNYDTDLLSSAEYLAGLGVHIINFSGGLYNEATSYHSYNEWLDYFVTNTNITYVGSAGNSPTQNVAVPSSAANAIAVGNVITKEQHSPTSIYSNPPFLVNENKTQYLNPANTPQKPELCAPGTKINVLSPSLTVTSGTGTSYSAPHVAGVAAQMMSKDSNLKNNPMAVKALLMAGARPDQVTTTDNAAVSNSEFRKKTGAGFVSAGKSEGILSSHYLKTVIYPYKQSTTQYTLETLYIPAGVTMRFALSWLKNEDGLSNMDEIDFAVKDSTGAFCAYYSSSAISDNKQLRHWTAPYSGSYTFCVQVVCKGTKGGTVTAAARIL